ncbi:MAG TPA: GNAT family N-acetyltransferase [Polyangiaceae bacterium]|nr:GNAT family N-acetyltransferase [Polyangiaceae bacterium]
MTSETNLIVEPAGPGDVEALAALLVQLFAAELPGALRGAEGSRRALLRYILEAEGGAALLGRYVARDAAGAAVGSVALRPPGAPPPDFAPRGVVARGLALFGPLATARMAGTLARTLLTPAPPLPPDAAHLHGLVVDAGQRGRGLGAALVGKAEGLAAALGRRAVHLQVVVGNHAARRLYARLGYRVVGRSPRWLDPLTFPAECMAKALEARDRAGGCYPQPPCRAPKTTRRAGPS